MTKHPAPREWVAVLFTSWHLCVEASSQYCVRTHSSIFSSHYLLAIYSKVSLCAGSKHPLADFEVGMAPQERSIAAVNSHYQNTCSPDLIYCRCNNHWIHTRSRWPTKKLADKSRWFTNQKMQGSSDYKRYSSRTRTRIYIYNLRKVASALTSWINMYWSSKKMLKLAGRIRKPSKIIFG